MKNRTKFSLLAGVLALTFLSSCSNKQTAESSPPEEIELVVPPPSNYDLHSQIIGQLTGEVCTQFEYLTQHLDDTGYYLQQVYHGGFTQNTQGELLLTYAFRSPPSNLAKDTTFLFIIDVLTGTLLSSQLISADTVEIFLLPSPLTTKIFVTETSAQTSSATSYSCNSGNWVAASALSDFSTLPLSDETPDPQEDYVYTFNGDTLTVEHREDGALSLFGIFRWNSTLGIFEAS